VQQRVYNEQREKERRLRMEALRLFNLRYNEYNTDLLASDTDIYDVRERIYTQMDKVRDIAAMAHNSIEEMVKSSSEGIQEVDETVDNAYPHLWKTVTMFQLVKTFVDRMLVSDQRLSDMIIQVLDLMDDDEFYAVLTAIRGSTASNVNVILERIRSLEKGWADVEQRMLRLYTERQAVAPPPGGLNVSWDEADLRSALRPNGGVRGHGDKLTSSAVRTERANQARKLAAAVTKHLHSVAAKYEKGEIDDKMFFEMVDRVKVYGK
jgi:hypothetical protein